MTAHYSASPFAVACPAPSAPDPVLAAERARIAAALDRLAAAPALAQRVACRGENDLVDKTLLLRLAVWVRDGAVVPVNAHG